MARYCGAPFVLCCAFYLYVLTCFFGLGDVHAAEPLPGWENNPSEATVRELAHQYNILAVPGQYWREGELEAMLLGAQTLPEALIPEHEQRVVRRKTACMYGVGRGSKACPDVSRDGRDFYVYTVSPVHGEGAVRTLKWLDEAQRTQLFYARAMVRMAMVHVDERHDWSERSIWKRINGWDRRGLKAFNKDSWGASRYRGLRSSREDLLTFAEEYFVRPEDILARGDASSLARLADYDWDLALGCQEFTKSRVLLRLIQEQEATYEPPFRGPEGAGPGQVCVQFERWANAQQVEGVDILLAAATADRPESLYGHLLLSVRYREGQLVRSRGFDPVYQYGAVTDTNVNKVEYFAKGLFGGFLSVIQPNTFRGTDRLFMQYEQRTLRRYALNLGPEQVRHVLERLWEAERRIIYPYYFLSDNCASMLIDLLSPALDELDIPNPVKLGLMPTEVLDIFSNVENGDRGALLVKRTETHFSSREVAMDAVPKRRKALRTLKASVSKSDAQILIDIDEALDSREPEKRAKAYALLGDVFAGLSEQNKDVTDFGEAAIDYLYYSSRVERYFMDLAFYERRKINAGALNTPIQFTAEEQIEMRRELYEEEDLLKRQEAMLALAAMSDERLRDGDKRPFTENEKARLERIKVTQRAYLAALKTLSGTIEIYNPQMSGMAFIEQKENAFKQMQQRRDDLSMGPAGKGRFMVGVGAGQINSESALMLEASASVVYERLGEQRRRGFRSDISSRALGLDIEGVLGGEEPFWKQLKAEGVVFEFMTVEQLPGPVRKSWRDEFGWGLKLAVDHDGRRGLDVGVTGEAGYVYPLWQRDNVANFLILGLYGVVRSDWTRLDGDDPDVLGVKPFLLAQFHLYGGYANVLRLELSSHQFLRVDRLGHMWSGYGRLQTEHVLGEFNQQLLLLRPYVQVEYTTLDYRGKTDVEHFAVGRAGVSLELPF